MISKIRLYSLVALLFLLPAITHACPLCQGGQGISENTISAYKGVTLFLALLPILGTAGIFYWIYKKKKEENN